MTNNYHHPIKISDNLSLYSGDVIKISQDSEPLLVEVIDNEFIKLRRIEESKYLSEHSLTKSFNKSLKFTSKFDKSLNFIVSSDNVGKVNLKKIDSDKYLGFNGDKFSLSIKSDPLIMVKWESNKHINDYKETMEVINLHKNQSQKIIDERTTIAQKSYDNKTDNPFEYNFELSNEVHKEHNLTWSKEIILGSSVDISIPMLEWLKMGVNLERKNTNFNSITKSETETIKNSLAITCLPWKETKVKLETRKIREITPYTAKVKRTINGRNYEYQVEGQLTIDNYSESRCLTETNSVRNILLVGCTGSGKSTLAKVLSGDQGFKEGVGSISTTKGFKKSKEFEHKENNYSVIDNIGFGDTKLDEREEMLRIGKAINSAKQGISHALFVFSGRFSEQEKEGFNKLAALKITSDYVTLVRSKFDNYYNEDECEEDKALLKQESLEFDRLFGKCLGMVHIDNDDKDSRQESREIVLNYLHDNCIDNPFKPKEWENISDLIEEYMKQKKVLELDVIGQTERDKKLDDLKNDTANQVKERIRNDESIREFVELIEIVTNK